MIELILLFLVSIWAMAVKKDKEKEEYSYLPPGNYNPDLQLDIETEVWFNIRDNTDLYGFKRSEDISWIDEMLIVRDKLKEYGYDYMVYPHEKHKLSFLHLDLEKGGNNMILDKKLIAAEIAVDENDDKIVSIATKRKLKVEIKGAYDTHEEYKLRPVEPIKDLEDIKKIKQYILNRLERYSGTNAVRYALFCLGINCARRISDILKLKFKDILNPDGTFKDSVIIVEQKTKKVAEFYLTETVKEALTMYINTLGTIYYDDYVFKSREQNGRKTPGHYTRQTVWNWMKDIEKCVELSEPYKLGTHSLRKTWATQMILLNEKNPYIIAQVSKMLNHSDIGITYDYLGFTRKSNMELCMNNPL